MDRNEVYSRCCKIDELLRIKGFFFDAAYEDACDRGRYESEYESDFYQGMPSDPLEGIRYLLQFPDVFWGENLSWYIHVLPDHCKTLTGSDPGRTWAASDPANRDDVAEAFDLSVHA